MQPKRFELKIHFFRHSTITIALNHYSIVANIFQWAENVKSAKASVDGGTGKVPGVLIASKTELDETRRRVSPKMGHETANNLGMTYFECSAKEHQGVDEPFYFLANEWHKQNTK